MPVKTCCRAVHRLSKVCQTIDVDFTRLLDVHRMYRMRNSNPTLSQPVRAAKQLKSSWRVIGRDGKGHAPDWPWAPVKAQITTLQKITLSTTFWHPCWPFTLPLGLWNTKHITLAICCRAASRSYSDRLREWSLQGVHHEAFDQVFISSRPHLGCSTGLVPLRHISYFRYSSQQSGLGVV